MSAAQKLIEKVLADHGFRIGGPTVDGYVPNSCWGDGCSWEGAYSTHRAHVAAEIDKALGGLTQETLNRAAYPEDNYAPCSRWVSGWSEVQS